MWITAFSQSTARTLEDVRVIYSHEQAIGQCSEFLAKLPNAKVVACANTAEAARMASESTETGVAAIASHTCAALYELSTLAEHIQNRENNYTRFICITRELEIYPGATARCSSTCSPCRTRPARFTARSRASRRSG